MRLEDIIIVLSRPSESGNVGAVCRAMKNMGLKRLRIVAPEAPIDPETARNRAIHAADVFDEAERFDTLEAALADCALSVATTRRRGKKRKDFSIPPEELADALAQRSGKVALVFGNERTGLEDSEVALCGLASHIPADDAFPSLNLSHAVQVFCYVLSRRLGKSAGYAPSWVPVGQEKLDQTVQILTSALADIGFYKQAGRREHELFFHSLLSRAGLTLTETAYIEGIFRKAARLSMKSVDNTDAAEHT